MKASSGTGAIRQDGVLLLLFDLKKVKTRVGKWYIENAEKSIISNKLLLPYYITTIIIIIIVIITVI